jgi:hypothetical protein
MSADIDGRLIWSWPVSAVESWIDCPMQFGGGSAGFLLSCKVFEVAYNFWWREAVFSTLHHDQVAPIALVYG